MGFVSQVQPSQGNQQVNPTPSIAQYSPVQQQYGGGKIAQARPEPLMMPSNSNNQQNDAYSLDGSAVPNQSAPSGKMGSSGQKFTISQLSGQPTMGQPNPYPNTIGQWDNRNMQPQPRRSGKGKGY